MDFCTCLFNSRSLSSMKDDAYIYNNVITCTSFGVKYLMRLPCGIYLLRHCHQAQQLCRA